MMEVQKFLRNGGTLDTLNEQFGIKNVKHEDGRVILNYCQINSPKAHPIVRECRGLTLHQDGWDVVSKSFDRFFNFGEMLDLTDKFDWNGPLTVYTKEDGSLMPMYYWNGEWHVNTRGSFADGDPGFSGKTWKQLAFEVIDFNLSSLNKNYTYVFEFCSVHNKVVRHYAETQLILLAIFNNQTMEEVYPMSVDIYAEDYGIRRPTKHTFNSLKEIEKFIEYQEVNDPTFEGVVVMDQYGMRLKIKSKMYMSLHHLKDNGNIFNPKNILPWLLKGEEDELFAYFPEVKPYYEKLKVKVDAAYAQLMQVFYESRELVEQKAFAIHITKKNPTPFSGLLFDLRKQYGTEVTDEQLDHLWRKSESYIEKVLL